MSEKADDIKLVHVAIVDGTPEMILGLKKELNKLQEKMPNLQFLISNDKIELVSLKYLLNELIRLYKQYKEVQEKVKK